MPFGCKSLFHPSTRPSKHDSIKSKMAAGRRWMLFVAMEITMISLHAACHNCNNNLEKGMDLEGTKGDANSSRTSSHVDSEGSNSFSTGAPGKDAQTVHPSRDLSGDDTLEAEPGQDTQRRDYDESEADNVSWRDLPEDDVLEGESGKNTKRPDYDLDLDKDTLWTDLQKSCFVDHAFLVQKQCESILFSCRQGCGLDHDKVYIHYHTGCHCDAKCLLYGDCCYDFKEYCPNEIDNYVANLSSFPHTIKCLSNVYTVIDGCRNQTANSTNEHDSSSLHSTDFVVTDQLTGLHYANYSVFSCNRLEHSTAIFWDKLMIPTISGSSQGAMPKPFSIRDARICRKTVFECNRRRLCVVKEGTHDDFAQLCSVARNYTPETMRSNNDTSRSTYGDKIYCYLDRDPLFARGPDSQFSVLTKLGDPTKRLLFAEPTNNIIHSAWSRAVCPEYNFDMNTCRVQKCKGEYFKVGQVCLFTRKVRLDFYFTNRQERESFNKSKLFASLDMAWKSFRRNFLFGKELDFVNANSFHIVYDVMVFDMIHDRLQRLPFTKPVLTELEKMLRGFGENNKTTTIIPKKVHVCATMTEDKLNQFENILVDFEAAKKLRILSHELCDVVSFFNSNLMFNWSVVSNYNIQRGMIKISEASEDSSDASLVTKTTGLCCITLFFTLLFLVVMCHCSAW